MDLDFFSRGGGVGEVWRGADGGKYGSGGLGRDGWGGCALGGVTAVGEGGVGWEICGVLVWILRGYRWVDGLHHLL